MGSKFKPPILDWSRGSGKWQDAIMCREFLLNVIMLQFPLNCYCNKLREASTSLRGRHKVDKVGIPNVKHRYLEHRSPLAWIPRSLVDSHIQFLKLSLKSPLLSNILCYGEMLLKYGNYVFSIMPRHSFKRVHQSHFQPFVFLSVALPVETSRAEI